MSLTTIIILFAVLAVSVALLLVVVAVVWWIDRYDREPLHLVAFVLTAFLRSEHHILKVELAEEMELMLAPA